MLDDQQILNRFTYGHKIEKKTIKKNTDYPSIELIPAISRCTVDF